MNDANVNVVWKKSTALNVGETWGNCIPKFNEISASNDERCESSTRIEEGHGHSIFNNVQQEMSQRHDHTGNVHGDGV